jgi:hypothetical protein
LRSISVARGSVVERGGHIHRAGAFAHGREHVEFQRREDDAALLKRPDAVVQLVGENAGGFPGAARGQHLFAVAQDFRPQSRGIGAPRRSTGVSSWKCERTISGTSAGVTPEYQTPSG